MNLVHVALPARTNYPALALLAPNNARHIADTHLSLFTEHQRTIQYGRVLALPRTIYRLAARWRDAESRLWISEATSLTHPRQLAAAPSVSSGLSQDMRRRVARQQPAGCTNQ